MQTELLTTPSFQSDLFKLPKKDQKKLPYALKQINADPFKKEREIPKRF